jgi:hypothetical protein
MAIPIAQILIISVLSPRYSVLVAQSSVLVTQFSLLSPQTSFLSPGVFPSFEIRYSIFDILRFAVSSTLNAER